MSNYQEEILRTHDGTNWVDKNGFLYFKNQKNDFFQIATSNPGKLTFMERMSNLFKIKFAQDKIAMDKAFYTAEPMSTLWRIWHKKATEIIIENKLFIKSGKTVGISLVFDEDNNLLFDAETEKLPEIIEEWSKSIVIENEQR